MIRNLLSIHPLPQRSFISKPKYVQNLSTPKNSLISSSKSILSNKITIENPRRFRWNKDPISKPPMPILNMTEKSKEKIESDDPRYEIEKRMMDEGEEGGERDEEDDDIEDEDDERKAVPQEYEDYFESIGQTLRIPLTYGGTVKIGRHTSITAAGRVFSFSALIVAGDGQGTAGIGYGKGWEAEDAMDKAQNDVIKNLTSIYRYEDRTIPKDIQVKYRATKLTIRRHKKGAGLRGHPNLTLYAQCFGIKDLLIKIHGSRNMHNCLRALEIGLRKSISPAEEARQKGKVFIDTANVLDPAKGETPFKFNNISEHSLWEDPKYFRRSDFFEDGIYVFGKDENQDEYDRASREPIEKLERERKQILKERSQNNK